MSNDRNRGVTVKVLDTAALEARVLEHRRALRPDVISVSMYGGPLAIAEAQGVLYALCQEGVGPDGGVTDEDPLEVDFHGEYGIEGEDGSYTLDMMPFAMVTLTPADLLAMPVKEEVDLADFIRTFGARLERNFSLWYSRLS